MDLSFIPAALCSLQTAVGVVNTLCKADGAVEKAELKLQLADIMDALADAKIALTTAGSHIAELEQKIRTKEELGHIKTWPVDGTYLTLDENGKAIDGPFCARCWDVSLTKVRAVQDRSGSRDMGYCPECKNKYP